jgi:hypothetical protein
MYVFGDPESEGDVPDPATDAVFLRIGRNQARLVAGLFKLVENGGASKGTLETIRRDINKRHVKVGRSTTHLDKTPRSDPRFSNHTNTSR